MSIAATSKFSEQILNTLRDIQKEVATATKTTAQPGTGHDKAQAKQEGQSFMDHLYQSVKEVNAKSQVADRMSVELATGRAESLHETMLAATQAELSFNLMVQVRNKALEAYQEVMRMPV